MTCINCGVEDSGKFCSHCAQPLTARRIGLRDIWNDALEHISGFDGMLLQTLKDLTLRPGFVAREFVRGVRVKYYGPVAYYLSMVSLFLLVLSLIDLNYTDLIAAEGMFEEHDPNVDKSSAVVADNMKLVAFILVPFMAFSSRYLFFRKQGMNFLEHSVPAFYMMGHWYWYQSVDAIVFKYWGYTTGSLIQGGLLFLYMGYGYTTFITTQPKWKTFLKGAGVYIGGFFVLFVMIALVALIMIITGVIKLDR